MLFCLVRGTGRSWIRNWSLIPSCLSGYPQDSRECLLLSCPAWVLNAGTTYKGLLGEVKSGQAQGLVLSKPGSWVVGGVPLSFNQLPLSQQASLACEPSADVCPFQHEGLLACAAGSPSGCGARYGALRPQVQPDLHSCFLRADAQGSS